MEDLLSGEYRFLEECQESEIAMETKQTAAGPKEIRDNRHDLCVEREHRATEHVTGKGK